MTDDTEPTLAEAEATLARLGARRRELSERRRDLQHQITTFGRVDQADLDARIRATLNGDYGQAERRSLNRLMDDLTEVEDELRVIGLSIDRQKEELAAARRRQARAVAAELAPEHDAVVARIVAALEDLASAQAAERELHARVRQVSGLDEILPMFGRAIPSVDHLLARAREHLAAKARAAA
jgi:chromosome segregation ATPase